MDPRDIEHGLSEIQDQENSYSHAEIDRVLGFGRSGGGVDEVAKGLKLEANQTKRRRR